MHPRNCWKLHGRNIRISAFPWGRCGFPYGKEFAAVFSNAVLHWIDRQKQPGMASCVRDALKPGGQFAFEFGGYGNNALIHNALHGEFRKRNLD